MGDCMPSAVPQTFWTGTGSTVALGSARTHTCHHMIEVTLQSLQGHPHLPDLPSWQAPKGPCWTSLIKNSSSMPDCGFHGWAQDTCTRITEAWIFHTFSLKITVFAFTGLGPWPFFVPVPNPCRMCISPTWPTSRTGSSVPSLLVLPYHIVKSLQVYNNTKLKSSGRNQVVKHIRQGNLVTGKKMSVLTLLIK